MVETKRRIIILWVTLLLVVPISKAENNLWLREHIGRSSLSGDKRFHTLCERVVPVNWQKEVTLIFGGAPKPPEIIDNRFFIASACKYRSCEEKAFMAFDLKDDKGLFVVGVAGSIPTELYYLSNDFTRETVPLEVEKEIDKWRNENNILVSEVVYTMVQPMPNECLLKMFYKQALSAYRSGNKEQAYKILLEGYFDRHDYFTPVNCLKDSERNAIFNDYALFIWEYYRQEVERFCSQKAYSTPKDFNSFKLLTLGTAKEILGFVIDEDSTRTVAYLNLADVEYELDSDTASDFLYKRYSEMMVKSNRAKKIPTRALNKEGRDKVYRCD